MEQQMDDAIGLESQEVIEDSVSRQDSAPAPIVEEQEEVSREPAGIETNDDILDHVLAVEAGYQNQSQDDGNKIDGKMIGTNRGITPKAYKKFYGKTPTVEDMKSLTKEQALEIYNKDYIEDPGFNNISDDYLKANLVDFGVNSGPVTAIKQLQKILGTKADGIIGPNTLQKVEDYEGDLNSDLFEARRDFYKGVIERQPEKKIYEQGWENRLRSLENFRLPEKVLPERGLAGTSEIDLDSILNNYADQEIPEAPTQEEVSDIEMAIDNVNQQQSSGDNTPVYQLDDLLAKIDNLKIKEEDKDELGNDAVNMANFSDGNRLKELLRKISELK